MAPEPAPGRRMVPLVPALVMLGLVAGAHGDSKSDPSRCGISQLKRWCPSWLASGMGAGPATRKDRMARYPSRPSVLERTPHTESPIHASWVHPVECRMSLKALQDWACLNVILFYGLTVRHVQDSCGHWVTCSGVYCVRHCKSVQKAQHEPCRGLAWEWGGDAQGM